MTRAWVAALPLALGCAGEAGHGFASVEAATLEARFEPGAARAVEGGFLTDQGYTITLESLTLDAEELGFDSLATASGGGSFDPAHPPPGYTFCHGGHCHAEDGSLPSYAEVEAALSGGGGFSRVVTFGSAQELDLLAPVARALGPGTPSSELPRTELRRVSVRLRNLELRGRFSSDDGFEPQKLGVTLTGGIAADSPFDLLIDEKGLGALELHAVLLLDGTLFDGVDLAALADEELQTTNADGVLGSAALAALAGVEISVRVTKR